MKICFESFVCLEDQSIIIDCEFDYMYKYILIA